MSITNVLDMGRTALSAQRLALEVTGENITNVNTPGYSRQEAMMETAPVSTESGFALGRGVRVTEVKRNYDAFLQLQLKKENGTSGQYNNTLLSLKRVEQVFNEFTTDGLGKAIGDFFNGWQDLSLNPQGQAERQSLLSRTQVVTDGFHRVYNYLNDVKKEANDSLEGLVSDINDKIKQIASLNNEVNQLEVSGARANELKDKRDQLVQDLSRKVGINYLEQNNSMLSVSLTMGQPLVDGSKYGSLSLEADPGNSGYYKILMTPPGGSTAIDVSSNVGGPNNSQGEIGGTLQIRDTMISRFQDQMDELAYSTAMQVNAIHRSGFDLGGTTGLDFFEMPAVAPLADNGNTTVGVADITGLASTTNLHVGMWLSGPGIPSNSFITAITGSNSIQISPPPTATAGGVALSFITGKVGYSGIINLSSNIATTADIAASDTDPTLPIAGATGNNVKALEIADLRHATLPMTSGLVTLEGFYNSIVGDVGVAVQNAQRGADQSDGILKQLSNLRDSIVGVSLDEELANLIKYQKAFQSAAKLINVGDEMMQTVIDMIR